MAKAGVVPEDFYVSTIYPTEMRVNGQWVQGQRMDAAWRSGRQGGGGFGGDAYRRQRTSGTEMDLIKAQADYAHLI